MMRYILNLVIMVIFCTACKEEKTHDLNYDNETIKLVIADLYIAAEALKDINENVQDSLRELYTHQIETIHNIEMDKMEKDIQRLMADPAKYKEIHQEVKDSVGVWFRKTRED